MNANTTYGLTKKTGRSIAWSFVSQFIQQVMNIIIMVILARLLSPGDFGVFAMVTIFSNFAEPFREWGFQAFLIQKKDIDREYEDTAFWAICAIGLLLCVFGVIFAPFAGKFFNNLEVVKYLTVLSVIFLISPLGSVQWALASRQLDFKTITFRDSLGTLVYGFSVCVLAFIGFGIWSLVIAVLCREFTNALLFWVTYRWRPGLKFRLIKLKEMLGFSINCIGSGVLKFFTNNIDNILVGKLLGTFDLGLYNLAFNTVSLPQVKLVSQINSVAFPAFSLIQTDKERLCSVYLKSMRMVLLTIVPLLSILFISAKDFVLVFYGEKWLSAVLPIQIMCFYGLIRSLTSMTEPVYLSIGRPDIQLKISLMRLMVLSIFIFFGVKYGIVGVAIAVLFYSLVIFYPTIYFCNRQLEVDNFRFYAILLRYLVLSVVVIASIAILNVCLNRTCLAWPLARMLLDAFSGLFVFFLSLKMFFSQDLTEVVQLIKKVVL